MKRSSRKWLITAAVIAVACCAQRRAGGEAPGARVPENARLESPAGKLHPPVVLLDLDGQNVLKSGRPVSTMKTCGGCHDTTYIAAHSYHASLGQDEVTLAGRTASGRGWDWGTGTFGRWNPLTYRYLSPPGEKQLDLGRADWVRLFGARHVGGGPAWWARGEQSLVSLNERPENDPETHVLDPATGKPKVWDWRSSGGVEMNCFLCHVARPDNEARCEELSQGHLGWANTATLRGMGIVERSDPKAKPTAGASVAEDATAIGWTYRADAFRSDGAIESARLGLQEPTARHCGACHGVASESDEPIRLSLSLAAWSTATKGQVFSSQRISESAVNLANKERLSRPWDVHAERMLECASCHFSINNPAAYEPTPRSRPRHLRFEPRRLPINEYLGQPSHQFAKGHTSQGTVARHLDGTMRRCEDCHDATAGHDWLPYAAAHFGRLSCEACHVPQMYAPAVRQIDWTLLTPQGEPSVAWRGLDGEPSDPTSAVSGYQPVLLPTRDIEGRMRLVPHNLITAWFWVSGGTDPRPVREHDLRAALLTGTGYHPEILAALDGNRDGQVSQDEQRLDTQEKVTVVRRRLEAVGVASPRIDGEVQPYSLHHGVGPKKWATRDCQTCHAEASRLTEPFVLASYRPGEVRPRFVRDNEVAVAGEVAGNSTGELVFRPDNGRAGLYVFGRDRWLWVNALGVLAVVGVVAGVTGHAGLRIYTWRRRASRAEHAGEKKEVT